MISVSLISYMDDKGIGFPSGFGRACRSFPIVFLHFFDLSPDGPGKSSTFPTRFVHTYVEEKTCHGQDRERLRIPTESIKYTT